MVASPVARSMFAMWLPASDAYQMSPDGVAVMPYGPRPSGSSKTSIAPVAGSSRPKIPVWPVNQRMPSVSKTAVFRLAPGRSRGSGKVVTSSVSASTRTIAFRPPSVIQALPSGPVMTPCGADPAPSGIVRTLAGRGVEVAERAVVLARVPDAAVRRGCDVVRMRAGDNVELPDLEGDRGPGRMASRTRVRLVSRWRSIAS